MELLAGEIRPNDLSHSDARRMAGPHGYRKETLVARFGGDVLMPGISSLNVHARMLQARHAESTTL
jgi:hypothetical protein